MLVCETQGDESPAKLPLSIWHQHADDHQRLHRTQGLQNKPWRSTRVCKLTASIAVLLFRGVIGKTDAMHDCWSKCFSTPEIMSTMSWDLYLELIHYLCFISDIYICCYFRQFGALCAELCAVVQSVGTHNGWRTVIFNKGPMSFSAIHCIKNGHIWNQVLECRRLRTRRRFAMPLPYWGKGSSCAIVERLVTKPMEPFFWTKVRLSQRTFFYLIVSGKQASKTQFCSAQ